MSLHHQAEISESEVWHFLLEETFFNDHQLKIPPYFLSELNPVSHGSSRENQAPDVAKQIQSDEKGSSTSSGGATGKSKQARGAEDQKQRSRNSQFVAL